MTAHRRRMIAARWLAAGGAVALAPVLGVALLLQNSGSACAAPPSTGKHTGQATYYTLAAGGMGNCSYPQSPADGLFVALSPGEYSASAACGTYLDVTGPKGTVRVKVTDQCPECATGHLDLSKTAFAKIGTLVDGIIPISYHTVTNPSPPAAISARIQDGSSRYWFSVMIDNHGTQLKTVEIAPPGGSYHQAARADYNYWVIDDGLGNGPFTIKIIDTYGHSATLSNIKLEPNVTQQTSVRLLSSMTAIKAPPPPSPTPSRTKPSPAPTHPSSAPTSLAAPTTVAGLVATTTPTAETLTLAAGPASHCGG